MQYIYYLIPLVLIVGMGIYYFTVLPKLKQKSAQGMQQLKDSLKGHEEEKKAFYLSDEKTLKPITEALKGEKIQAIVSCLQKQNFKDVAKRKAINALSDMSRELVGMEFGKDHNEDAYFLVVTDRTLHYLVFKEGELKEKIDYEFSKIKAPTLGEGGIADVVQGGQKNYKKFTFDYDGEKIALFFIPMITFWPSGYMADNYEPAVLFGEVFEEKLKEALGF